MKDRRQKPDRARKLRARRHCSRPVAAPHRSLTGWADPIILGAIVLWAGLIALTLKPVWTRTLAHVPLIRERYSAVMLSEQAALDYEAREAVETRPFRVL